MFKKNYYFFVSGLPDILFNDSKSILSYEELKTEISEHLKKEDYQLAELIYLNFDNYNLLNLLLKNDKPFHTIGKYTQEELEDQIKEPSFIMEYMKEFILEFVSEERDFSDLYWENKIFSLYYTYVTETNNAFLNQWFSFDRAIKNIFTAYNCREFGYDVKTHLIKGSKDSQIYDYLATDPPKYDLLVNEVILADKILQIADSNDSIVEKENKIDMLKWAFLEDATFFHYFTIEKILAFILKLDIVERWLKHEPENGKMLLENLINNLGVEHIQENNI
jgi:hypothetical protein